MVELYAWTEAILAPVPGMLGKFLRRKNYSYWFGQAGEGFNAGINTRIQSPNAVFVGDNVGFNDRAWVAAHPNGGQIYIGSNTLIGPNCVLHTGNHIFTDRKIPIRKQGHEFASINIGDDVWVSANVTILKGVSIGKGAIIAAGSVVTKSVEPFQIVGGVPAKVIGIRKMNI